MPACLPIIYMYTYIPALPCRHLILTLHHITSHHITSHHITSHHITSHHTTPETNLPHPHILLHRFKKENKFYSALIHPSIHPFSILNCLRFPNVAFPLFLLFTLPSFVPLSFLPSFLPFFLFYVVHHTFTSALPIVNRLLVRCPLPTPYLPSLLPPFLFLSILSHQFTIFYHLLLPSSPHLHVISRHIISSDVMRLHLKLYHIILCHVMACHRFTLHLLYLITSRMKRKEKSNGGFSKRITSLLPFIYFIQLFTTWLHCTPL